MTGVDFSLIRGPGKMNPQALRRLSDGTFVDSLIQKFAHFMDEYCDVRNRILDMTGVDFFDSSSNISQVWRTAADEARANRSRVEWQIKPMCDRGALITDSV